MAFLRPCFVLLGMLVMPIGAKAWAAEGQPVPVLVVPAGADDPFVDRLRVELGAAGFRVEVQASEEPSLEALARRMGAEGAARTVAARNGVEVWMGARAGGRPMIRNLVVDERPQGPDVGLVVLQTTELLRTGLLLPQPEPAAAPAPVAPPVVVAAPAPTPSEPSPWFLWGGPGFLLPTGGLGAQAFITAGVGTHLGQRVALGVAGGLPVTDMQVQDAHGQVNARLSWAGVDLTMVVLGRGVVGVTGSVGWSYVRLTTQGIADAPFSASSQSAGASAGHARLGVRHRVRPWLTLGADVLALVATTRMGVSIAGRQVASYDRLAVGAATLLEVRLP